MVVREWGEIQQLYMTCIPRVSRGSRATQPAWVYWGLWALIGLFLILSLISLVSVFSPASLSVFGFEPLSLQRVLFLIPLLGALLVLGAFSRLFEKACANEFKMFYIAYGLRHYPWWRRGLYLHYARFLHALTNRTSPVSRETITRLRSFADIAGKPRLESRLLQPAYIVPYLFLLNALIIEVLKQTELLKGQMGIRILISYAFFLFIVLFTLKRLHVMNKWSGQAIDCTIQRFLQWAEHDIEASQRLKIRSPSMELPSSPES
jgi:hypothetical protein